MHIQTLFLLLIIFLNFSYHLYTYLMAILLYSRYGTIFIWNTCWCCWSTTITSRNERMKLRNIRKFPIIITDIYWATFITVFPITRTRNVVAITRQFSWAPISTCIAIGICTTIPRASIIFPRKYTFRACWNLKRIQMNLVKMNRKILLDQFQTYHHYDFHFDHYNWDLKVLDSYI